MKPQESGVYREIQRSADRMIKTLDCLSDKIYDSELSLQVAKQALGLSEIYNEASERLLSAKAEGYRSTYLEDFVRRSAVQYNTLLNTSTGHIAEMLIADTTKGIVETEKTIRHHPEVEGEAMNLAIRMLQLEENSVSDLKSFL